MGPGCIPRSKCVEDWVYVQGLVAGVETTASSDLSANFSYTSTATASASVLAWSSCFNGVVLGAMVWGLGVRVWGVQFRF